MELQIGSALGDYEIAGILGAGGMGKVYKVRNVISDRVEAMKVLLPDLAGQADLADRFLREIKVQASLEHPNIAALHTALRVENQLLMLMEFVEGVTLEQRLKDGPLPVDQAVDYVGQALSALEYAHKHGVIHRDIKPANMMLTPRGVVKLMDFGIAKASSDHRLTVTGTTMGSLYYMSPEQIQGASNLDARADLYSVGVSLYELVTGKHPFDGDSQFAIMSAHLEKTPVPPISIDPRLPQSLNDIILLSVAKDPNARFQTAGAFRNALANVMPAAPPVAANAMGPAVGQLAREPFATAAARPTVTMPGQGAAAASAMPPQVVKPSGRRGLWMAIGALATAAVVIGAIEFGPWKGTKAAPQPLAQNASQPTNTQPVQTQPPPVQEPVTQPSVTPPATSPAATQPAPTVHPNQTPQGHTPVKGPLVASSTQLPPQHVATQGQPVQPLTQTQPQPLQQQPPPLQAQPQAQPAAQPTVNRAEMQAAREQLAKLNVRANGVQSSLQSLQRSQAASGLNLSSKFQEPAGLMSSYLQGARDALTASDPASAKDFMDKAERQLEILEKLLNR